jgi:hypothetical protein
MKAVINSLEKNFTQRRRDAEGAEVGIIIENKR